MAVTEAPPSSPSRPLFPPPSAVPASLGEASVAFETPPRRHPSSRSRLQSIATSTLDPQLRNASTANVAAPDAAGLDEVAGNRQMTPPRRPSAMRSLIRSISSSTLNTMHSRKSSSERVAGLRQSLESVSSSALPGPGPSQASSPAREWERMQSESYSVRGVLDLQDYSDGLMEPGQLLKVVQHGETSMATSLAFQRTLTRVYLAGCLVTALLHCVLLLVVVESRGEGSPQWQPTVLDNVVLPPALMLFASLLFLGVSSYASWGWASRWPQTATSLLLYLSTVALEGPAGGWHLTRWTALPWGFLGVMLQASSSNLASRSWLLWLLGYFGLAEGMIGWVHFQTNGQALESPSDVDWWREVLMGWNLVVSLSLCLVPLGLSSRGVLELYRRGRKLLWATKRHFELEDKLLDALAPAALSKRFLDGGQFVVSGNEEGTVMFVYVVDYEQLVLCHGAGEAIAWVNTVFKQLDMCIDMTGLVTKVETFNNFLLVFCVDPLLQVQVCLELAIRMLNAVESVNRPDGTPTVLKIGISSGPFTAGIIGLQSPKYSIFGDTINTASRMASTSIPCRSSNPFIHISPSSHALYHKGGNSAEVLAGIAGGIKDLSLSRRDKPIEVKGKGLMHTFCLWLPRPEDPVPQQTSAELS